MIGAIGKLFILVGFVSVVLAGIAYFRAAQLETSARDWRRIGRGAWLVSTVSAFVAYGVLFYLSLTHQFQYAYIYSHTSRALGLDYLISACWAGQEGSFMLWIVLNGLVGFALMKWARGYESPTMAVVALCQFFLFSMVAGLKLGDVTIGSSPFMMLAEKFPDAPMLQAGLIPTDGQGLNDLLQNYWMVIHPPTLFVGFAAMIVPFAFAVTALWKKQYTQWVRPALPWALFASMILGLGIAMGGYWAYVTLSFGGYWAWDPVENSSLVPWIVGIAAIHTMIVQKRSGRSHKAALLLNVLAYMLVIYSTFLTRSGILGDISVHSFVDLGLYNQLLLWILTMGVISIGLYVKRYRQLPTPTKEPEFLSREFMIFAGAILLSCVALVVILGTSAPIIGRIFRSSPSTVPIEFYNKWTLPLAVMFTFLAGLGQLFWWNRMSPESVNKVLFRPVVFAVAATVAVLLFTPFVEASAVPQAVAAASMPEGAQSAALLAGIGTFWAVYGQGILLLLLLFVAFFALYGNGEVAWRIARGNPRMAGGAIAHIGLAIMILGIISSSGFSNPLGRNAGVRMGDSRDNFVLSRGETRVVSGYTVTYRTQEVNEEGRPRYVLDFKDPNGRAFTVAPVVYKSNKDQWIQHPDVTVFPEKDLFVAVSPNVMFGSSSDSESGTLTLARGDSVLIGEGAYAVKFVEFDMTLDHEQVSPSAEVAVGARIDVFNLATGESRQLRPVYQIAEDRSVNLVSDSVPEWGLTISFAGMNVDNGAITLQVEGIQVAPEDWLVVQAYEKPMISLVWIGLILLTFGFGVSIVRRTKDERYGSERQA
jgi:cytochrome c-type biogenesis protein CcmF